MVDDAQGQIFATKDGSLRLVTGAESKWIKGKVELKLTVYAGDREQKPLEGEHLLEWVEQVISSVFLATIAVC